VGPISFVGQEPKGPNQLQAGENGWVGPVQPGGSGATDIVLPRGLYYANDSLSAPLRRLVWE